MQTSSVRCTAGYYSGSDVGTRALMQRQCGCRTKRITCLPKKVSCLIQYRCYLITETDHFRNIRFGKINTMNNVQKKVEIMFKKCPVFLEPEHVRRPPSWGCSNKYTTYSSQIHFNIIFTSMPRLSKWPFLMWLPTPKFYMNLFPWGLYVDECRKTDLKFN
jgi:hypothetical protein